MNHVGIVLISHSNEIVSGLKKILSQLQTKVPISVAGGTLEGEIGTNAENIKEAIESVYSDKGVVILFDLGSALINAELAIEMLEKKDGIYFADAPIVEGAYAAVIESGFGSSVEEVLAAAEGAKTIEKLEK